MSNSSSPIFLTRNQGAFIALLALTAMVAAGVSLGVSMQPTDKDVFNELSADYANFKFNTNNELAALNDQDGVIAGLVFQVRDNLKNYTADELTEFETRMSNEILKIRGDIISKHPKMPEEDPANVQAAGDLTASLQTDIIFLGQSITIWGKGQPDIPVFAVVVTPDRSIQGADVARENGDFVIDIPTEFEDTAGSWTYRVSQGDQRTVPQPFEVKP